MEVEAFHDGYLSGPLAASDAEYPVGQAIGYIAETQAEVATGEAPVGPSKPMPPVFIASPAAEPAPVVHTAAAPPTSASGTRASPYARRLAHELGVDLSRVGSSSGAIRAADVVGAAQRSPRPDLDAGPPYRIEPNTSFREAVARTMIASAGTPMFRVTAELRVGPLVSAAKDRHLSLNVLFARAAALTIKEHPLFNAVYTPDGIARRERIDVGIAVDTPEGLLTPVLRDADGRCFAALAEDWRVLVEKAAARRVAPADYRGATFYVSDLGVFPVVYSFDSIIPLGASALLSEAVLGAQVEVPTPGGRVRMRIPPHSDTGTELRLRGRGVPAHGGRAAGDLYATLRVVVGTPDAALEDFLRNWHPEHAADPRRAMETDQ